MTIQLALLSRVAYRGQEITGPRPRSLLALLAGDLRTGCSTARLVEGLWPEELPEHPAKALQVVVSRARAQLGADVIASTPTGYRLSLASATTRRRWPRPRPASPSGKGPRTARTPGWTTRWRHWPGTRPTAGRFVTSSAPTPAQPSRPWRSSCCGAPRRSSGTACRTTPTPCSAATTTSPRWRACCERPGSSPSSVPAAWARPASPTR